MCDLMTREMPPRTKVIALKDFKKAYALWGLPNLLPPGAALLRSVWQIWDLTGRGFDVLVIESPKGSRFSLPVPKIETDHIDHLPEYEATRLNVEAMLKLFPLDQTLEHQLD